MTNIFDYLLWRGDLNLGASPFNCIDGLILCEISYMDLGSVVKPNEIITMREAAEKYFTAISEKNLKLGVLIPDEIPHLFKAAAESVRFGSIVLSEYVNKINLDATEQFSAVTADLCDGTKYIAFRGTDDTLVGWKENLKMSLCESVAAQNDAAEYLKKAADCAEKLRIGGHSKGGNLAVYAAMEAGEAVQSRIIDVCNYDGPGFGKSVLDREEYIRIRPKIKTLLPQSSVVGMLLEHEDEYDVIKSSNVGVMQHDGFSWNVKGNDFVRLQSVTKSSLYVDETLKAWIDDIDLDRRREFIETIFGIIESTGAQTLTDLSTDRINKLKTTVSGIKSLDKESRDMVWQMFTLLLKESTRGSRKPKKRGNTHISFSIKP